MAHRIGIFKPARRDNRTYLSMPTEIWLFADGSVLGAEPTDINPHSDCVRLYDSLSTLMEYDEIKPSDLFRSARETSQGVRHLDPSLVDWLVRGLLYVHTLHNLKTLLGNNEQALDWLEVLPKFDETRPRVDENFAGKMERHALRSLNVGHPAYNAALDVATYVARVAQSGHPESLCAEDEDALAAVFLQIYLYGRDCLYDESLIREMPACTPDPGGS